MLSEDSRHPGDASLLELAVDLDEVENIVPRDDADRLALFGHGEATRFRREEVAHGARGGHAGIDVELGGFAFGDEIASGGVDDWNPVANTATGAFAAAVGADADNFDDDDDGHGPGRGMNA